MKTDPFETRLAQLAGDDPALTDLGRAMYDATLDVDDSIRTLERDRVRLGYLILAMRAAFSKKTHTDMYIACGLDSAEVKAAVGVAKRADAKRHVELPRRCGHRPKAGAA